MAENKISEGYVLGLFPLLGIGAIAIYQMGIYIYFGVPLEFLEIDTIKIILGGLSLSVFVAVVINALIFLYEFEQKPNAFRRFIEHLFAVAFVTAPVWARSIHYKDAVSWPTIAFIVFCAAITLSIENGFKKIKNNGTEIPRIQKIEMISTRLFFWNNCLTDSHNDIGYELC